MPQWQERAVSACVYVQGMLTAVLEVLECRSFLLLSSWVCGCQCFFEEDVVVRRRVKYVQSAEDTGRLLSR
jgi:hypothetical protein